MRRTALSLAACILLASCFGGAASDTPANKGTIVVPGFSVPALVIQVKTEDVLLFEYESEEATTTELQKLSLDGMKIGDILLPWQGLPVHIFATGQQIAVYLGSTREVLETLKSEGGEQVAGSPIAE